MEFRAVFISNPASLSVRKNQLIIRQEQEVSVPMEDISSILLESRAITITAAALPPRGSVRMLVVTETQYSGIEILLGTGTIYDEPQQMEQLMLF